MKAVLVIEMPKTCDECPLHVRECLCDWCVLDAYDIDACPLKPLPKKKNEINVGQMNAEEYFKGVGWNACLKEIEGD